jgi:hypothetical protein
MTIETVPKGAPDEPARRVTGQLVPLPTRRKADLKTLEGVRREMARVYRAMEEGKRETQEGSRLTYVLTQIAKVLEFTEIERRISALEDAQPARLRRLAR